MKYYIAIILFSIVRSASAVSFDDCYQNSESTLIQKCTYDNLESIKEEYKKERNEFIKGINDNFDDNAKEVIKYEKYSSKKWQEFIDYQCKMEASAKSEINSYGYNIQYGSCMFDFYKDRIEFFHKITE
ncbi:hypothetical protein [Zymobacter sp. IVIA_5232.4 C2]|uniref:hypothetical protein n=1 Tax=Zymobacter sp. IVIA_5232.4 C2 TaxID=3394855 RepID=UPI0039C0F06F